MNNINLEKFVFFFFSLFPSSKNRDSVAEREREDEGGVRTAIRVLASGKHRKHMRNGCLTRVEYNFCKGIEGSVMTYFF